MGPEELRATKQAKVSTELQEGQGEARPGQHQGQLSVALGAQRPPEIIHSFIRSFILQIFIECPYSEGTVLGAGGHIRKLNRQKLSVLFKITF